MPDLLAKEMVGQGGDSSHNSSANTHGEPRTPSLGQRGSISLGFPVERKPTPRSAGQIKGQWQPTHAKSKLKDIRLTTFC